MNPAKIEDTLKLVLVSWIVIIAAAWLMGRLCRRIGQPPALGEIAAGLLLGPSFIGLFAPDFVSFIFPEEVKGPLALLAKIGLLLMLFQVGMEFDFSHLRKKSKVVISSSIMGILAPLAGGLLIAPWLHRTFAPELPLFGFQLFVCIALSISALPIMGRILLEMKLERTALGATAISAAAIDDAVGWIFLGISTALIKQGDNFSWVPFLGQTALIVLYFYVLMKVVGPFIIRAWRKQCAKYQTDTFTPGFLALLFCTLFVSALITSRLGIFAIFGAFAFGVALHSEPALVKAWRDRFADFVIVALVPIFFTNTGLNTKIGSFDNATAWIGCFLVSAVAIIGKLGGCTLGARWAGASWREGLSIGALLNTRALMGLIAISVGKELGLLNDKLFTMFIIMCLVTTATTGPMLRAWLPEDLKKLVPKV
ncbi:cation:proton antiporter [Prosthecobacter sp.]|uniref:cation:proton antiporter n=1 Tax=Prosthecobacter sp. TaxID=1965333 RepID=UPI00248A27EE|nr:cation:proton antiporter [Prosthecobacter sp.]MDI1314076.1 cation:proton antiporter [Prosthecobacter sp.]